MNVIATFRVRFDVPGLCMLKDGAVFAVSRAGRAEGNYCR